jgi:hypothetical protein
LQPFARPIYFMLNSDVHLIPSVVIYNYGNNKYH